MIYLLENNEGQWFKGFGYDKTKVNIIMESELTTDANKAWQFSNKNDAEYYIKWQTSPVFTSQEFVVTEYELKSAETPIIETELEIIEKQIRIASELHNDMKTITEYGHDGKKHEFVLLSEYEKLKKEIAELKEFVEWNELTIHKGAYKEFKELLNKH